MPTISAAILLAAGKSERAGNPKGLILHQGIPWMSRQLQQLSTSFVHIVVVLGHHHERYLAAIPELKKCKVVINPEPDRGPFSSLQVALSALHRSINPILILPLDVPSPYFETIDELLDSCQGNVLAAQPRCEGKLGHPVVISIKYAEQLIALSLDDANSRLDRQLAKLTSRERAIVDSADPNVLLNLNTIEDFKNYSSA